MPCFSNSEILTTWSDIFEILTPVVLFVWFIYSRRSKSKLDYLKEIPGLYGGYVQNTVNISNKLCRYEGAILMEIFDIDSNGYFRGQFTYQEKETPIGTPFKTPHLKMSSINFFVGKLSFRWNLSWRKRNPILWKTNRIYKGDMYTINRLDDVQKDSEEESLERVYKIKHHRESRTIEFIEVRVNKQTYSLPKSFVTQKSYNHLLDPYRNIKASFNL